MNEILIERVREQSEKIKAHEMTIGDLRREIAGRLAELNDRQQEKVRGQSAGREVSVRQNLERGGQECQAGTEGGQEEEKGVGTEGGGSSEEAGTAGNIVN
jgi:hypothetical protein